jgi:hypothetical protein
MTALRQDPHLSGQAFARKMVSELCELGLQAHDAKEMIHIVGPGRALTCYQWIRALKQSFEDESAIRVRLNRVARESRRFRNEMDLARAFSNNELPVPNGGFKIMMRCMRVAQYLGFISEDIGLREC